MAQVAQLDVKRWLRTSAFRHANMMEKYRLKLDPKHFLLQAEHAQRLKDS